MRGAKQKNGEKKEEGNANLNLVLILRNFSHDGFGDQINGFFIRSFFFR